MDEHDHRRHQDVPCPTCHAPIGQPCVTIRLCPWTMRCGWPTYPAHIARQEHSAHPPPPPAAPPASRPPCVHGRCAAAAPPPRHTFPARSTAPPRRRGIQETADPDDRNVDRKRSPFLSDCFRTPPAGCPESRAFTG